MSPTRTIALRARYPRPGAAGVAALCACVALAAGVATLSAAEVHSNGRGGGRWSDPETWHGGRAPTPQDDAVIAMRDIVEVDLPRTTNQPACANVFIDPEGVLSFQPSDRSVGLAVNGSIESFGTIRMDGTTSSGLMELRLLSDGTGQRTIRLLERSALLLYGRKDLSRAPNVAIVAAEVSNEVAHIEGLITAGRQSRVDVHHAHLTDLWLNASMLDNTGAQPLERLNVIGSLFTGSARLYFYACDTPAIRNNRFETGPAALGYAAIVVNVCSLADVRGNRVEGPYAGGIQALNDTDSTIAENVTTGCAMGIYAHGRNTMIRDSLVSACGTGLGFNTAKSVVENVVIEEAKIALDLVKATVQVSSCRIESPATNGVPLRLNEASVTLLNCNIDPDQVAFEGKPPENAPWVETMQYLVVKAIGNTPPGAEVLVRTAEVSGGVPGGKADLNVRNAPARIAADGMTPLPRTLQSLIVRSWRIEANRSRTEAPFYDLVVSAPSPDADQPPKVLKQLLVEPDDAWFRPDPNGAAPTVEVVLP